MQSRLFFRFMSWLPLWKKVGISIKPNTKVEEILEFLPLIHLVLVMTVEPGYGGQKLIPKTIDKVKPSGFPEGFSIKVKKGLPFPIRGL